MKTGIDTQAHMTVKDKAVGTQRTTLMKILILDTILNMIQTALYVKTNVTPIHDVEQLNVEEVITYVLGGQKANATVENRQIFSIITRLQMYMELLAGKVIKGFGFEYF